MQLQASLTGGGLSKLRTKLLAFAEEEPALVADALNAEGSKLHERTISSLARQSGLSEDVTRRAEVTKPAEPGRLMFTTIVQGGNVRLKYFGAKESGGGVLATPWNRGQYYPGAFIKSGRAPNRKIADGKHPLNGQVYTNVGGGKWGGKIRLMRSGLFLPVELTRGDTARTFEQGAKIALEGLMTKLAGEWKSAG